MPAHESMRPVTPVRCDRIQHLTDPDFLAQVVGPIASVEQIAMGTPGFSGSTHTRLHVDLHTGERVSLVLKRTLLDTDWVAYRSGDRLGREAMLLSTAELAGVWDVFANPYVACAVEPGATGLLMHDLSPYLFPDVREPIELAAEDALLSCLARLHARYRQAPALELSWLAQPAHALSIVGPIATGDDPSPSIPSPMRERVHEGWAEAFRCLPPRTANLLRRPPDELERAFSPICRVRSFMAMPRWRTSASFRVGAWRRSTGRWWAPRRRQSSWAGISRSTHRGSPAPRTGDPALPRIARAGEGRAYRRLRMTGDVSRPPFSRAPS